MTRGKISSPSQHPTVMPTGLGGGTNTQFYSVAEITEKTPLPPGFGVILLEDARFYPLLVQRWEEPELIGLDLIPRPLEEPEDGGNEFFCFDTRVEAVRCCYRLMEEELCRYTAKWDELTLASCVYPERCAWYQEIIEVITGESVSVRETFDSIRAESSAYVCSHQVRHRSRVVRAPTIDEALEALANQVYARTLECYCGVSRCAAMVGSN